MTTKEGYTTITISKDLKTRLQALKSHPRQSYEEVIEKMLKKGAKKDETQ
jgi:predicted CopG family antitoxin